jgi:hypothetical protein
MDISWFHGLCEAPTIHICVSALMHGISKNIYNPRLVKSRYDVLLSFTEISTHQECTSISDCTLLCENWRLTIITVSAAVDSYILGIRPPLERMLPISIPVIRDDACGHYSCVVISTTQEWSPVCILMINLIFSCMRSYIIKRRILTDRLMFLCDNKPRSSIRGTLTRLCDISEHKSCTSNVTTYPYLIFSKAHGDLQWYVEKVCAKK